MKKTTTRLFATGVLCTFLFTATAAWATSGSWDGTVDALWTNSNNWSASPYPSGTDTATFNTAGNGRTLIDLSGLTSIAYLTFDSASVAAYTNGTGAANSQTLVLEDNGIITLTDTAAKSQLFNAGLQLGTTIAAGTYTLTNGNTSQTLTFNNVFGPASGGAAGAKALNISGVGNTTILGAITNGGATSLTLTHNSSGTLTLSGANTFNGGLTITKGTVVTAQASGLGAGAVTNNSTLNLTGGAVTYTGLSTSLAGSGTNNVTLGTGSTSTVNLNGDYSAFTGVWNVGNGLSGGKAQMNGLDNSAATINVLANATLYCAAAVTHTAKLFLNGGNTGESHGQLRMDLGASWAGPITLTGLIDPGDVFFGNGADSTISGVIDDLGQGLEIGKVRVGTLILTGSNTFSGPVWAKAGAISVPVMGSISGGASPLGSQTSAVNGRVRLGSGTAATTLIYTGVNETTDRLIDLAGTTGGANLTQSGTGLLRMTGGMMISGSGAKTLTLQGSTAGTAEFAGAITNGTGSTISVTKAGTGTWTLSGTNTYSGTTTLSDGRLNINNGGSGGTSSAIGTGTFTISGGTIDNTSGADITLSSNNPQNWNGNFTFAGSKSLNVGTGAVTLTANRIVTVLTNTLTVGGAIGGSYTLTKTGAGTLTISGANTYSGATTVNSGKLLVNASTASTSALTVNNGCTLGGSGTINGTVAMVGGSMMEPGDANSIGTLTLGNGSANALTLNGNGLRYALSNVVDVCDKIFITGSGALVLNGVNIIALTFPNGSAPAGDYTLMTFQSYTGGGSFVLAKNYPNATLVLNPSSLVLHVEGGNTDDRGLTWKGNLSGIWDNNIANWTNGSAAVAYAAGDAVTFDDTATGNFTVSSVSPVSPAAVLFDNSVNEYTVSADITGDGALKKMGASTATLSGVSTYNPGVIAIASGTLTLGGSSLLNNGNYATNILNSGTFNYASSATQTLSGAISGSGALTVSGSGPLKLTGTNTLGVVTVNGGTAGALLTLNGSMSLPGAAGDLLLGTAANDRSVLNQNGTLTITRNFHLGTANPSAGACYQTSGIDTVTDVLGVGVVAEGYGYYRLDSGTLHVKSYFEIATYGSGVFDMFGGILTTDGNFDFARRSSGVGVMNVFGGTAKAPSGTNPIQMGRDAGPDARLTIMGSGIVDAANGNTTKILNMNTGGAATTAVNLLTGGTLIANKVSASSVSTTVFNFDGGTLKASPLTTVGATFLTGLDSAIVYPGGAVIDTTNATITIAQSLKAPEGYGISAIPLISTGTGYIGAPLVTITGGSGTGVTAIASVDLADNSPTKGKLTGVTMTSKGTGYMNTDVLTVTLSGGGFTTAAVPGTCEFAANSAAGGLTKLGSGTLTLSGANTYGGATTVGNGTLRLGIANALPTNNVVNVGSGIFDLGGFTVTNGAVTLTAGGSIINGKISASSVTVDGAAVIKSGVSASADITKHGSGTLAITRYMDGSTTGSLVVNGGTLKLVSGPMDIGLSYWLDAADTNKLTLLGTNVTDWADSTANGVNFTQVTTANQPVYVTNVINGLPAVRFNGTNHRMVASKTANAQTVFIVNNPRAYSNLDGIWGRSSADNGIRLSNATTWQHPGTTAANFTYNGSMYINGLAGINFVANAPHLLTAVSTAPQTWTTAIGQYYSSGSRWFNGDIGELLVYNSILSESDRKAVEGYLMSKWFGTANTYLPTGGAVLLAAGTLLDLGGGSFSFADLSGSGTVSNGTLTVTGDLSPAGTSKGTLTSKANTTLSGKLIVDVATDGTSDLLDVQGNLTLLSPTLEIADLQGLSTLKVYTLVTCLGTPISGSFTLPENLSNTLWTLRKTLDNKIQLYYKGGTLISFM